MPGMKYDRRQIFESASLNDVPFLEMRRSSSLPPHIRPVHPSQELGNAQQSVHPVAAAAHALGGDGGADDVLQRVAVQTPVVELVPEIPPHGVLENSRARQEQHVIPGGGRGVGAARPHRAVPPHRPCFFDGSLDIF
eukprot:scaffold8057_cov277-Pinguiococcus_pyrenoidosus.AAC.1